MRRAVLLGVVLLAPPVRAQASTTLLAAPALTLEAAATAKLGTHENAVGLRLHGTAPVVTGRGHSLVVRGGVGAEGFATDLGVPGASVGAQPSLEVALAAGSVVRSATGDPLQTTARQHEVAYTLIAYLDSDGTSQGAGGLRYRYATPVSTVEVEYENDALVPPVKDRYRTAAIRLRYTRTEGETPVGIGLRAVLWTGTTEGLGRLGRDESYDLTGQHGAAHPHGILALDLARGGMTASLGLDAEAIRSAIQNTFHDWIDRGAIPERADRPVRVFVRLALNEGGGLY